MNAWLRAREALTVMDVVMRVWARQLLLEPGDVPIVLHLGAYGAQPCARLALWSGRTRQQVHKSLKGLAARQVVCPARLGDRGTTRAWAMTSKGVALYERLTRRMDVWEAELRPVVDLEALAAKHQALLEFLVARPLAHGWRKGLRVPLEVRVNPYWDFASLEAALAWREEAQRVATAPLPEAELAAQEATSAEAEAAAATSSRRTLDQQHWERAAQVWEALWR